MNGLINQSSIFTVAETVARLIAIIDRLGVQLFANIDHAKGAADAGLPLRPTQLLILGNPAVGTALMQDNQLSGIDLPAKILVWQDVEGKTWVTSNDLTWIAKRYSLGKEAEANCIAINNSIAHIISLAIS